MNCIIVPEDTYTVSSGGYKIKYRNVYNNISYESETNTSEYFISKYINNIKSSLSLNEGCYTYNYNQNYMTIDYYDNDTQKNLFLLSTTAGLATENYWMYPLSPDGRALNTMNFPVTRTISIVINSNTLPVYNIPNDITLGMDVIGSYKELTIPAGDYTYSTMNDLIYNFVNTFNNDCSKYLYYVNAEHFEYSRLTSRDEINETEYTGASLVIHNNDEFNKYYGLLHMIYTYPENHSITTTNESRRFSANMPPVYRSLHIPEGEYTVEDFINYINNNSEYHYTCNGVNTYSYTQFLAKVVDNDIVIYTDDGTEFFINPICKMNTYKETNFASEHKLCSISHIKVYIIQENTIKYNFDTIKVSPSNYKQIFIENPWYLDTSEAPDFQNINDFEKNTIKNFTVPEDTYTVIAYRICRYTGTNIEKSINVRDRSHYDILKYYFNTLGSSGGDYVLNSSNMPQLKYYYLFDGYSAYGNGNYATFFNGEGNSYKNNSILIPVTKTDGPYYTTFQEIPIITNISITFDSNTFALELPEHRINGKTESSDMTSIIVPAGKYTCSQYHDLIKQVIPYSKTWGNFNTIETMFRYPFCMTARRSNPKAWYCGDNTYPLFNDLYCKLHLLYPCSADKYIAHACNGPATHRCLSCTAGIWNIDDFINYVNTTDDEKLFGCRSTTHEIFVTASMPFIINPACSMTKLGEADITPENSTNYKFGTQKRILYHPMYKEINCTVTYNGTTHTISGRYTPAELLREIKTLTNADIKVYNNNDEYNINFPEGLTISDNPFFTSTENLSGLSRMNFTVSNNRGNFSYNNYIVNTTDTTHEVSISPTELVNISIIDANNLPNGLQIDSQGNITGIINYSDTTGGKVSATITVNGTSPAGIVKSISFKFFVNFMNIDYEINSTIINEFDCHMEDIIVLKSTNVRGSITDAWVLKSDLTVTMLDNYDLKIWAGVASGMYILTVKLLDEKGQIVEKEIIVNVYKKPYLSYNTTYNYEVNQYVMIYPSWTSYAKTGYTFSITSGTLPSGLSMNTTGITSGYITGITNEVGSYNITVTMNNPLNNHECKYNSVSYSFTLNINYNDLISYNDYTVNTTDTTCDINIPSIYNIPSGKFPTFSQDNIPYNLNFDEYGNITGTINYSDAVDGKVSETITVNYTTSSGTSKSTSFKLFVNFMNIDYNETGSEYHTNENIIWQPSNIRGSITSASIVDCASNLTVTISDNYELSINTGTSSGTYQFSVKLTDEKGQTVTKVMTVNVFRRPILNYNDKYYYSTGDNVLIEPSSYAYSKDIIWNYSNLPEGLSFNNGIITGSTNETGSYNITVTLIESLNNHECEYNSVSDSFTISIISIISIGYSQSEYTFTVNESVSIIPAIGDYTYSLSGNLPCGLTFGSDGSITGVCDHPVITMLLITISLSDITKTVELTINILPVYKCKCNIYSRYYIDNELNKCEVVLDKGFCNEHEFTLNDNEINGLVGPYMCILLPNHTVDLNIQTITDDNYETNNNNVNCYIKGFPSNEQSNYIQPLDNIRIDGNYYYCNVQVRDANTDEIIEQNDGFDLRNLDFTDIINYFNEKSTKQLSITYDDYCIYLHGVDFIMSNDCEYYSQYFKNYVLILEHYDLTTNNKILLELVTPNYGQLYYNNTICFISTSNPDNPISFDIPSSSINNGHILCSYVNEYTYPITLYMDVVSPLAEQNASDLKTLYQVSKFVYEVSNINYDLTEFTIPIGCYFTTTPVTEIEGPYVLEGVLPDGLTFDPDTGNISGTCNEIINSSVNIITGDTSVQLTFNTVRIQTYSTKYIIHYKEETNIEPITPVTNYFGDGVITYENELPSGCTFDTSTGVITITSANKFENISINCIQSLDNTELRISSNILIRVMFSTQLEDNIFKYS